MWKGHISSPTTARAQNVHAAREENYYRARTAKAKYTAHDTQMEFKQMSIRDTKTSELEIRLEKLQRYVSQLEKFVKVSELGIELKVGETTVTITENDILIKSDGSMNILSSGHSQILSNSSMLIESSGSMDIKGSLIHIN